MSENAIDVRGATGTPEPPANNHVIGRAIAEPSVLSLSRGPSVFRTTLLMARVTFREAARRKILWIATLAGIAFLTLFWIALHFVLKNRTPQTSTVEFREGIVMMTMMVLYAGSMMTSLMAVLTSCDTLSGRLPPVPSMPLPPSRCNAGAWCSVSGWALSACSHSM